jgi:hypothetical protein
MSRTGPPTSDGVYVVKLEQYGDCVVERRDGYYYENGQCLATQDCDILAHRPHVPLQPAPQPASVRCFKFHGGPCLWAMSGEHEGQFFDYQPTHQFRSIDQSFISLSSLIAASDCQPITPAAALAELADWPEAQAELRAMMGEEPAPPASVPAGNGLALAAKLVCQSIGVSDECAPIDLLEAVEQVKSDLSLCRTHRERLRQALQAAEARAREAEGEAMKWRGLWSAYRQTEPQEQTRGVIFGELDHHWREVTDDPIAVEARAATSQLRELERQQLHAAQARIAELEGERAALAERIRGIECIAGAHETWKAGFRDGLNAAAQLAEGNTKGTDHARP